MGITYSIAGSKIITQSWDNMLIPLPFHKGMYAITEPVFIPENTTDEELEIYRQKIEQTLNELTWKLDKEMGLPFIAQGKEAKKSRKTNNENEGK